MNNQEKDLDRLSFVSSEMDGADAISILRDRKDYT